MTLTTPPSAASSGLSRACNSPSLFRICANAAERLSISSIWAWVDFNIRGQFLDAGVDVDLALRFGGFAERVERTVEVRKQALDLLAQGREPGKLRRQLRKAVFEQFPVVRELLHSGGKRPLRGLFERSDLVSQLVAGRAQILDPAHHAFGGIRQRRQTRLQAGKILLQARYHLRCTLDLVAAVVALSDEVSHLLEADVESDRVAAAGNFGQRPLDIVLSGIQIDKKLFDRTPLLHDRTKTLLQHLLAGADRLDAGIEIADLVAALLRLQQRACFREPLLKGVHGVFRIGPHQLMHRHFGFDLGLYQSLDVLPDAVKAQFQRQRRLTLPDKRLPQPDRGGNEHQRHHDHNQPRKLRGKRLLAEGSEYCAGSMSLGQDQISEGEHEDRTANSRNITQ